METLSTTPLCLSHREPNRELRDRGTRRVAFSLLGSGPMIVGGKSPDREVVESNLGGAAVTRGIQRILVIAEDGNELAVIRELLEKSRPNLAESIAGCYSLSQAEQC
jgi:hypothetical protein